MKIAFTVNGRARRVEVPPMKRLLDVLREDCRLTGTKEGCGEGECGACSVMIGSQVVNACLVPACQAEGERITTIEGIARQGRLHPLQKAFLECGGAQCGICTPGMIVAAAAAMAGGRRPDRAGWCEALQGNLCRCTGYTKILEAVQRVSRRRKPTAGRRRRRL